MQSEERVRKENEIFYSLSNEGLALSLPILTEGSFRLNGGNQTLGGEIEGRKCHMTTHLPSPNKDFYILILM
jgi:hypothetical protein